ncbi:NADPH-dependent oxidoreductase [Schaalia suimastitidis]|uniref:NADPH-dependent oxidoreductase n=1 Tax=Schaalia suimastitidis TaxID=121163 RepID=UPI000416CC0E|nr:NADPH-dependent oxidoreductase [Schaalia suimastitidis]
MTPQSLTIPETTPVSTPTIDLQLRHRTIRSFTDQKVSDDVMQTLFEVARHTATCAYLQQLTIIHVKDPDIRQTLCEVSGQPYVGGDRGELIVFVADLHRNAQIRAEVGIASQSFGRINMFLSAAEDVLLAAQNVVVAAESLGLGTVYLGSIGNDPQRVVDALKLPSLTYPVLGLVVGYPNQEPQFKPRLPLAVTVGVDTYPQVDSYTEALASYDEQVTEYYDLRNANQRVDSFTAQVRARAGDLPAENSPVLEVLHRQGLALS